MVAAHGCASRPSSASARSMRGSWQEGPTAPSCRGPAKTARRRRPRGRSIPRMHDIDALLPLGRGRDTTRLREYDADALARYVADPANAWWRRRRCVHALAGRVPESRVPDLIARVRDAGETTEVRVALLDVLGDRTELLPWLRHEEHHDERPYGMAEAVLKARGRLGDLSAAEDLVTLAASPWSREQDAGRAGLDTLVARHGPDAVLARLGDARPEDRMFRIRMRARSGEDVTDALADPDRAVAHLAQSLADDPVRLRAYLTEAPTTEAKLWAACALHRLTEDGAGTRAVYESLGRPRVEVAGLDEELRAAIVHEYAPGCRRRSDPRWRVEALVTDPPAAADMDDRLRRATAALAAAGLTPGAPPSRATTSSSRATARIYRGPRTTGRTFCVSISGPFRHRPRSPTIRTPPPGPPSKRPASGGSTRRPVRSPSPTCASTTSAAAIRSTSAPCSFTGRTDAPAARARRRPRCPPPRCTRARPGRSRRAWPARAGSRSRG
ncbi:predicted protein [Streptomyces pristinaespiralis ATCC 25486]|uniref:Predicted protein n=1 Tax=Streptomyces pristinaespiralis (strain ATCC 25486 / DSM 40338 / CBS 914.69 / JCM 4507 / KCC S-0507 / NBRC 13074 / NRRL 2958 / 5647) TaxID=457429 RepID=D6X7T2_STRE2|nr:predicted protein [Streptomyces pristinaespiralis ATCC 25486]